MNQLNKSAFMGLTGLKREIAQVRGGQLRVLGSPWAEGVLRGLGRSLHRHFQGHTVAPDSIPRGSSQPERLGSLETPCSW